MIFWSNEGKAYGSRSVHYWEDGVVLCPAGGMQVVLGHRVVAGI